MLREGKGGGGGRFLLLACRLFFLPRLVYFLPKIRLAWAPPLNPPFELILLKTLTYFRYTVLMSPKKDETAVYYCLVSNREGLGTSL